MTNSNLIRSMQLPPMKLQKYERYLPSAFDDSLSYLDKLNKVIHYLYYYSELTEEMLTKWNEVYKWVYGEGLDTMVGDRLREWLNDGTFATIINEVIFNELNNKLDSTIKDVENNSEQIKELNSRIDSVIDDLISNVNKIIKEFESSLATFKQDFYMLGETTIYRGE